MKFILVAISFFVFQNLSLSQHNFNGKGFPSINNLDTLIELVFPKYYKIEDFRQWCNENGYIILDKEIEKLPRFGKIISVVTHATIIDKKIKKALDIIQIFREQKEVNCFSFCGRIPELLPDEGKCYVCFNSRIYQVPIEKYEVVNYWLNDISKVEIFHQNVKTTIFGHFERGLLQNNVRLEILFFSSNHKQLHFGTFLDGYKNGPYKVLCSNLGYVSASYFQGTLMENFKVYPFNVNAWGAYPVFNSNGVLSLYVKSDSQFKNIWTSTRPIVACLTSMHLSTYSESTLINTFIGQTIDFAFNQKSISTQDIMVSLSLNEFRKQLKAYDESNLGADIISFIICLLNY